MHSHRASESENAENKRRKGQKPGERTTSSPKPNQINLFRFFEFFRFFVFNFVGRRLFFTIVCVWLANSVAAVATFLFYNHNKAEQIQNKT